MAGSKYTTRHFVNVIPEDNKSMYNREAISKLAKSLDERFERRELNDIVETLATVIVDSLRDGETINLSALGKFTMKVQPARRYYNIHKAKAQICSEKRTIIFTPNKRLIKRLSPQ